MAETQLIQESWSEAERARLETEIIEHLADSGAENQALAPVLQKKLKTSSQWDIFVVWFTASIKAASWSCGALAVTLFGLSPLQALFSIAIGNVLGGILVYITGAMGRNGMPQTMMMIPIFGRKGAKVPQFLMFFTVLGWTVANTVFSTLLGQGIVKQLAPNISTVAIGVINVAICLVITLSAVFVANKGYEKAVKWLKPVTYVMIVILVLMTIFLLRDVNWTDAGTAYMPDNLVNLPIMFISAVGALGVGYLGTWAPFASDFTRYVNAEDNKTQRKTGFTSAVSGWICCTWLLGIGALAANQTGGIDPAEHIAKAIPFLAVPALLVVLAGSWSTLVVNYISTGLDLKALGVKMSRPKCTSVAMVIVLILSLISFFGADIASTYFNFLLFLILWVVPWVCIQAMDYFIVNKRDYSIRGIYGLDNTYDGWNVPGVVSLVVGFIAGWLFCNPGNLHIGPIPLYSPLMRTYFGGLDISYLVGAAVTCLVYYFASVQPRLAKMKANKSAS